MSKKSKKVKDEVKPTKTQDERMMEVGKLYAQLESLDILKLMPDEITNNIDLFIRTGQSYYIKYPFPELQRNIEVIMTNKKGFDCKINLLYKP